MATFNAGSIEATLDLDVDPFQRGLSEARNEGRRFAQEKFTATLELDDRQARSELAVVRRELERVATSYTARVDVDGIAKSTAEVEALNRQLSALGSNASKNINVGGSSTERSLAATRRGLQGLIPLIAIASTGLVPLTAAAVPVLGLANNLTLTVGAAGSAFLAIQGVGGALKAANAAAIEPSAANLAKMHAAMSQLHPEARAFIADLRDMAPAYHDLQRAAAGGFFPGVRRGLEAVDLRDYRGLVRELGSVGGIQLEKTLNALDDPRWVRFFRFIKAEARPGVDAFGTSIGNLAGFFASLWMAFDPLNDDFSDWLVSTTADMRGWADALPDNPAFQDFIAYVREQGPHAADALGSIAGALVDVVKAAAPLGGAVLDVLTIVGHLVSDIAESPIGPVLLEGLSAIYLLNKALAVTEGLMTRTGLVAGTAGTTRGVRGKSAAAAAGGAGAFGFLAPVPGKVSASWRGLTADTKTYTRSVMDAGFKMASTSEAAERMAGRLRTVGKGAAGIGAVATVASGLSDKLGVTQTMTMGLAGAMIGGVPGAIAGGLVGALMDATSAGSDLEEQQRQLGATLRSSHGDFAAAQAAMQGSLNVSRNYHDSLGVLGKSFQGYDRFFTGANAEDQVTAQAQRDQAYFDQLKIAGGTVGRALSPTTFKGPGGVDVVPTVEKLGEVANRAAPAMQALGYSWEMLANMDGTQLAYASKAIADWTKHADTAAGRTDAFAGTVAQLGNDALSTADSAAAMSAALDALLSPTLDNEAALDQWHASLKALEADLKAGAGFKGYGDAAMKNREITRQYATDSMARLKALAGVSTTSEKDMANAVAATRSEFIKSGMAAGFSRKEIVARAKALGLTPKLVKTVFEAAGISEADLAARDLRDAYDHIPKDVRARIGADGIPQTMADVNALVKRYDLTEKQRTALLTLRDLASSGIINVQRLLDNLNGKTATTYVRTVRTDSSGVDYAHGGQRHARGGPIYGPGTGTSDSIPAWLSNGEHVWTAREVANAGGHAAVEALREQFRFAAGGIVDWTRVQTHRGLSDRAARVGMRAQVRQAQPGLSDAAVDRIVAAIRANRGVYAHVSSREDVELALRALEAELSRPGKG